MKKYKGFTLFELLVSISIIAILTALAVVSYSAAQKKARDARREEDMQNIQKAAEQYYMLNSSSYPFAGGTPAANWTAGSTWTVNGQSVLQGFPLDPKGIAYTAPPTTTASAYCMCAYSENAAGNCANMDCNYSTAGAKNWFCVNNQQ